MENLSWEYISYARHLVTTGTSYTRAFNLFMLAFQSNPNLLPTHEAEFRSILLRLNNLLAAHNKFDVIFENFEHAITFYPNNVHILNDIGTHLYKYGFYQEAWDKFETILKINPHYVTAEKNLNSIKNIMVERWHFRMLNDHIRNEYYRSAIKNTVNPGVDSVLDVGTGTGLLAMYAREAGALKVLGCDGSEVMSQMAQRVIVSNKMRHIKIVNKMSTSLNLWKMGGKCSLLVTELFDAGLLGEHVLQMLAHAWTSLLAPKAQVIPNSAEFFIIGIQCDSLNRKYQLCNETKKILNIPSVNVHILTQDETYDSEDVHLMQDVVYMTEPMSVLNVNFNNAKDIDKLLHEEDRPFNVSLKAKQDGLVNAVIGYFNLHLSDTITVTTNMKAEDRANAWQQAVFFDALPRAVQENDSYDVQFLVNSGKLQLSTGESSITRVSPEIIKFLNDTEFLNLVNGCIGMACVYLGQLSEISQISIVDLCPFPFFGLQMMRRGAKSLLCFARNDHDKRFMTKVFNENKVSMSNVTIIDYGDEWTLGVFGEEKYHAIFTHCLELCGDVHIGLKEIASHLRQAHLLPGGLFMPAKMQLVAQLVSSHWLDINNKLYNENVSNYKIAHALNKYQVTQNFEIDFNVLKYVPISEPIVVCTYPNSLRYESVDVQIVSDGFANAILCWYKLELLENMKEITTNRKNSLIDGTLFLTNSRQALVAGNMVRIAQHKNSDDSFKLTLETDPVQ